MFLEAKLSKKRADELIDYAIASFDDEYKWKLKQELKGTYNLLKDSATCSSLEDVCVHQKLLLQVLSADINKLFKVCENEKIY